MWERAMLREKSATRVEELDVAGSCMATAVKPAASLPATREMLAMRARKGLVMTRVTLVVGVGVVASWRGWLGSSCSCSCDCACACACPLSPSHSASAPNCRLSLAAPV